MPLLSIQTNQPLDAANHAELLKKVSSTVAETLGKPERYVMVTAVHNDAMLFAGSDAPMAYLELKSIGLPENGTTGLSEALCRTVSDALSIDQDRIYIEFANAARHMWGWNGGTF